MNLQHGQVYSYVRDTRRYQRDRITVDRPVVPVPMGTTKCDCACCDEGKR